MDFLDPKKQRAHMIRLIIGYILIGLAIVIATTILLRIAYGFGLDKNGKVVQNGFVFVSSQPSGSQVYINNKLYKNTTSTRLQLPEGNYEIAVKRPGYTTWQRQVSVVGNTVIRYDYPLLIPTKLISTPVKTYSGAALVTQSPDRHWLLVQPDSAAAAFDVFDISDPKKVTQNVKSISLPAAIITDAASSGQSWKLTEWSTDNRHVILQHSYSGGSEYILVDRQDATKSLNLTKTLGLSEGEVLSLRDKKFDTYYVYDPTNKTLETASVTDGTTKSLLLNGVLAFKSYGADMVLYATDTGASAGQVVTMLKDGDVTYKIREIGAGGPYLMDLAQYSGDWYVAVGSSVDNKVYIFKNPQSARKSGKVTDLIPVQLLRVTAPNYLEFSANTRFIMIENGTSFAVYDVEYDESYTYATSKPLDAPQTHAAWMDGTRLTYVSGGRQVIVDYDNTNFQTLAPNVPGYLPAFDRDYRYVYNIAPATGEQPVALRQTSLLIPKDQ